MSVVRTPLLAVTVLAALLTGCGGDPAEGLQDSRRTVRAGVEDVASSLGGTAELVDAAGQWSVCSAGSSDRVEYAASLGLRAQGDPVALVRAVGERLGEDGWEVTDEGDASVNLERDGVRVGARPSVAEDDQVVVEVSGGCVDGSRDDVDSLDPEPVDVG
ncbi:hypothetical protein [Nocardioides aurantiacus]|uniref:Uncharacterized protein n=1 Tax=Nocardioides aurantiacus TaxID=86796 RepID=A0A3N2CYD8_9ACTN|nr:hypothetical protein [Nocardioides aurantiacus]ROR92547.1 hypothetical protein EDD33_3438 [Nocardioides aurantiacus]